MRSEGGLHSPGPRPGGGPRRFRPGAKGRAGGGWDKTLSVLDSPGPRPGGGPLVFVPGSLQESDTWRVGGEGGWIDTLSKIESPRSARPGGGPRQFLPGEDPCLRRPRGGWSETLTQIDTPRSARPGGGPRQFRPGDASETDLAGGTGGWADTLTQVESPRSARPGGGPLVFVPGTDPTGGGGGGWTDTLTKIESPRSARPGGGPLVFVPGDRQATGGGGGWTDTLTQVPSHSLAWFCASKPRAVHGMHIYKYRLYVCTNECICMHVRGYTQRQTHKHTVICNSRKRTPVACVRECLGEGGGGAGGFVVRCAKQEIGREISREREG